MLLPRGCVIKFDRAKLTGEGEKKANSKVTKPINTSNCSANFFFLFFSSLADIQGANCATS